MCTDVVPGSMNTPDWAATLATKTVHDVVSRVQPPDVPLCSVHPGYCVRDGIDAELALGLSQYSGRRHSVHSRAPQKSSSWYTQLE